MIENKKTCSPAGMETFDLDDIEQFDAEMCPVIKEGWLWKRKQRGIRLKRHGWQRRYFVADNKSNRLNWSGGEGYRIEKIK